MATGWATLNLQEPVQVDERFKDLNYCLLKAVKVPERETPKEAKRSYPYNLLLSEDLRHINILPRESDQWSEGYLALNFTGIMPKIKRKDGDNRLIEAFNLIISSPVPTFLHTRYNSLKTGRSRIRACLEESLKHNDCTFWFRKVQLPTRIKGKYMTAQLIRTSLSAEHQGWTLWRQPLKAYCQGKLKDAVQPCFRDWNIIDSAEECLAETTEQPSFFIFRNNNIEVVRLSPKEKQARYHNYNLLETSDPMAPLDPPEVKAAFRFLYQTELPVFVLSQSVPAASPAGRRDFIRNFIFRCKGRFKYRDVLCEGGKKVRLVACNVSGNSWTHFGSACKEDHNPRFKREYLTRLINPKFREWAIKYDNHYRLPELKYVMALRRSSRFPLTFVFEANKIVAGMHMHEGNRFYAYNLMGIHNPMIYEEGALNFAVRRKLPIFIWAPSRLPARTHKARQYIQKVLSEGFFWYKEADCGDDKKVLLIRRDYPRYEEGWTRFSHETHMLTEPTPLIKDLGVRDTRVSTDVREADVHNSQSGFTSATNSQLHLNEFDTGECWAEDLPELVEGDLIQGGLFRDFSPKIPEICLHAQPGAGDVTIADFDDSCVDVDKLVHQIGEIPELTEDDLVQGGLFSNDSLAMRKRASEEWPNSITKMLRY